MKIFLDSTNIDDIINFLQTGLISGLTTNPSLMAKANLNNTSFFTNFLHNLSATKTPPLIEKEIMEKIDSISFEVIATEKYAMIQEAKNTITQMSNSLESYQDMSALKESITIKVPCTEDGLFACRVLSQEKIKVNVTLCFSPLQALLAAKSGASYISPFVGRLDDITLDGMELIHDIKEIYDNYGYKTEILVASVRTVNHILEAARLGAHIVTVPPKIFHAMYKHPLTDKGLEAFLNDWNNNTK